MQQTLAPNKMPSSNILPGLLRRMTVRAVFETLQQDGARSRADLSRSTGISPPTISKAVSELLDRGLISETMTSENLLGRPGLLLTLCGARTRVIGIAVSAASTVVSLATLDGQMETDGARMLPIPVNDSEWLLRVMDSVRAVMAVPEVEVLGIGICCDDVPTRASGTDSETLADGQLLLRVREVSAALADLTGLSTVISQPGQGLALAERLRGKARRLTDFVVMDVSTSPSLGVFIDGQLLTGRSGMAGQLRMTGSAERSDSDDIRVLSRNIAAVINLFDPAALFLRSRSSTGQQQLLDALMKALNTLDPALMDHCRIDLTSAGLQSAAVATIVDEVTRGLGPRLSVPLVGTAAQR